MSSTDLSPASAETSGSGSAALGGSTPDTRAALVAAARAELDENGRAAVSLRAVARRAGVSHAAPGYLFRDRAGLLTAVAASGFHELAAALDADPAADLESLGRRYVEFAWANPALYALMFRSGELDYDDPELGAAHRASITALVRETQVDGQAAAGPTDLTVIAWALAHGIAALGSEHLLGGIRLPDGSAPQTEALIATFAGLVRRASSRP